MVPAVSLCFADYIRNIKKYAKGFPQTYKQEAHSQMSTALHTLISQHLVPALEAKVSTCSLSQIVSLIASSKELVHTVEHLNMHLPDSIAQVGLISSSSEKRVFALINAKIDEFGELADWQYIPDALQQHVSTWLAECISFLETTCSITLVDLPEHIKSFVYYESIFHLQQNIMVTYTKFRLCKLLIK